MTKLFGNLHLVLLVGLLLAIIVMMKFNPVVEVDANGVMHWLHTFFGVLWIGLLYYLNFVQVPTMPSVPAELKKGVTGYIAPKVFFFFRYSALLTVLFGIGIAAQKHYLADALLLRKGGALDMIGIGMWLGMVMFLNVWLLIWPNQKKILGIVEATDEEKAKATPIALAASRTNLALSLPMLYCMVSANLS